MPPTKRIIGNRTGLKASANPFISETSTWELMTKRSKGQPRRRGHNPELPIGEVSVPTLQPLNDSWDEQSLHPAIMKKEKNAENGPQKDKISRLTTYVQSSADITNEETSYDISS